MGDFLKKGWHPKGKEGGKESWRGDFKGIGQVAGWMGKPKQAGEGAEGGGHIARPLATLKDPSMFGPPPKNVNYHGGAALPNEITPHTGGLGAPLSQHEVEAARASYSPAPEEVEPSKPAPPALPYRADRTGLSTNNLPIPPVRRDLGEANNSNNNNNLPRPAARSTPNLPPRLPSRQNTSPSPAIPSSPPAYEPTTTTNTRTPMLSMNQTAMSRLGSAGVSVPALGIGKSDTSSEHANPWKSEKSQAGNTNQMSELQSRFSRMNKQYSNNNVTTENADSPSAESNAQPPTWQQTQSTLNTARNLHQDPSKVSLQDAQNAANTAQSAHNSAKVFREKHSDKIDAAEKKANTWNKKYNVTGRLNRFLEDANDTHDQKQTPQPDQQPQATGAAPVPPPSYQRNSPPPPVTSPQPQTSAPATIAPSSIARKPPPPPPPKKPSHMHAPPPVPLGTKPNFG